jgi:hypothetical protein
MNEVNAILNRLLEDEGDFDLKDLETKAGPATVKRHKNQRMKVVDMPGYAFLISYLTPVAYLDKSTGTFYRTKKQWSPTTNGHISTFSWMHHYPHFEWKRQAEISELFRTLLKTVEMKPKDKQRLYHIPPEMRQNYRGPLNPGNWTSGHGKIHPAGEQGLPMGAEDPDLGGFFSDFNPANPDYWDWQQSNRRSQEPHEDE